MAKKMTARQRLDALEELANETCGCDYIEFDTLKDKRHISEGNDGIWVRAWVHLDNDQLEEAGIFNPEAPTD